MEDTIHELFKAFTRKLEIEENIPKYLDFINGVFCSNDILAYALYVYCTKNNIHVPDKIKIVGYDYCQFARMLHTPKLTTVSQPIDMIGKVLFYQLMHLINKNKDVYSQQLSVALVLGETT